MSTHTHERKIYSPQYTNSLNQTTAHSKQVTTNTPVVSAHMTRTLHTPHRHSHNPVCVHPTSKWTAKAFGQLANEDETCHHVLYDAHVRGLRAMNHVQRLCTRTCLRNHTNSNGTLSTPNRAINSQQAIVQTLNVTKTLLRTRSTRQQGQQHSSDIWKHLTKKPACRRMSQHFS